MTSTLIKLWIALLHNQDNVTDYKRKEYLLETPYHKTFHDIY